MVKFLCFARYTTEGLKGLSKDKASGRRAAVCKALESAGGKLEAFYYALGKDDVVVICDMPDNASAAALSVAVGASGTGDLRMILLLTVEEMDQGLAKPLTYRRPGQ